MHNPVLALVKGDPKYIPKSTVLLLDQLCGLIGFVHQLWGPLGAH